MIKLILFTILTLSAHAQNTVPFQPSQDERVSAEKPQIVNILPNGGAEKGTAYVTASAGTFTTSTTAANISSGRRSFSWDASATSQTLDFTGATNIGGSNVLPAGLQGQNCEASFWYKGGGTADIRYWVEDTSATFVYGYSANTPQWVISSASAGFTFVRMNFACPSASTMLRIRFQAQGNAAVLYLDDVYLGRASNVGTVSQVKQLGTLNYAPAANCAWTRTGGGSDSFGSFSADSDCATPTLTAGSVLSAPGTKIPAVTYPNAPAGTYRVYTRFSGFKQGSGTGSISFRVNDGSLNGNGQQFYPDTAQYTTPFTTMQEFTYSSAGNRTWEVQGLTTNTSNSVVITAQGVSDVSTGLYLSVDYYPPASQQAINVNNPNYTDWTPYTAAFTGFGTVTVQDCQSKREAQDLLIRCRFTSATSTNTEARVGLPSGLTSASYIATLEYAGQMARSAGNAATFFQNVVLIEPNVTYVTFGAQQSTTSPLNKLNGNGIISSGDVASFQARVPIQGWTGGIPAPTLIGGLTVNSTVQSGGMGGVNTAFYSQTAPSMVGKTNVSSVSDPRMRWMRIGNVVTGSGSFSVDCTSVAPTYTEVAITPPVASAFTNDYDAGGAGSALSGSNTEAWSVYADNAADTIIVGGRCSVDGNKVFSFSYNVK